MALCLPPCGNDCATVECARNDFEIQLPRKSDFRRVITVERYVFKDREEITLELSVRLKGDFFTVFKNITLHGYYTSEVAFSRELNLEIIPGAFHGCTVIPAGRKA